MSRITVSLLAATVAAAPFASPAFAAEPTDRADRASVRVQYGDLDLGRDAGVDTLYARLRGAARRVCEHSGTRDLRTFAMDSACSDQALDAAIARVNNPHLSARHGGVSRAIELADARLP